VLASHIAVIEKLTEILKRALTDSSAVRLQTLPLRLWNWIPSAAADFTSACKYLYSKIVMC